MWYVIEVDVDEDTLRFVSDNDQDSIEELIKDEIGCLASKGIVCNDVFKYKSK